MSLCDHWCKVARAHPLGFTFTRLHPHMAVAHGTVVSLPSAQTNAFGERLGSLLVHSWCTSGAFWCAPGALPVHFRCTPGALSEHSKGFPKGNCFASERKPRSSWIAFSPICKPERELHRFRKEASILRTETFGSFFFFFPQLANPKGKLHRFRKGSLSPPHRNVWIAQDITTFITGGGVSTTRPQQKTPQTLPTERSMNGPGAHPAQRAVGTCRCASTATFILRTAPVALEATAQPGHPPRVRQLGEQ